MVDKVQPVWRTRTCARIGTLEPAALAQVVAQAGKTHRQRGVQLGRHVQHHHQVHAGIDFGVVLGASSVGSLLGAALAPLPDVVRTFPFNLLLADVALRRRLGRPLV